MGRPCQALKRCFSACLLELGPMFLSADQWGIWAAGLAVTFRQPQEPLSSSPNPCSVSSGRDECVPSAGHPVPRGLAFPLTHQTRQRAKTWSPECSLENPPILGPSKCPGPPSENEEAALTTLCQLLALRAFMHIPSGNCPCSN